MYFFLNINKNHAVIFRYIHRCAEIILADWYTFNQENHPLNHGQSLSSHDGLGQYVGPRPLPFRGILPLIKIAMKIGPDKNLFLCY